MPIAVTITESNIFTVLGNFITSILPSTVTVERGQQNRVAQPPSADSVIMWPLNRPRLSTNIDSYNDIAFIGSISGNVLTVTKILQGVLSAGLVLDATNITAGTAITAQTSGPAGGVGTYTVNNAQTLASTMMQAGSRNIMQPVQVTIQVDVHGPNSADNATIISTLLRDEFGVYEFDQSGFSIEPLYCNDPRQLPFINDSQQVEERWIVEVVLQANPTVSVAQDFAGSVKVGIIDANNYPV